MGFWNVRTSSLPAAVRGGERYQLDVPVQYGTKLSAFLREAVQVTYRSSIPPVPTWPLFFFCPFPSLHVKMLIRSGVYSSKNKYDHLNKLKDKNSIEIERKREVTWPPSRSLHKKKYFYLSYIYYQYCCCKIFCFRSLDARNSRNQ